MPPVRTPVSTKGLKTERTHEENQERAYIAASRRSDRSLEARLESARRASEIHKKRTGRALRVTEKDVLNEEMYEEEDEDLQSQYRRLQAHLGTTAQLFNGRLSNWFATQAGMRQMAYNAQMGQAMGPGAAIDPSMFNPQTPFFHFNPQMPQQLPSPVSPSGTLTPSVTQRGQFRQTPYPIPSRNSLSASSPTTAGDADAQQASDGQHRRASVAVSSDGFSVPSTPLAPEHSMQPPTPRNGSMGSQSAGAGQPDTFNEQLFQAQMAQAQMSQYTGGYPMGAPSFDPMNQMQSPLTTALPVEAQQMVGSAYDHTNPYMVMLMNQNHGMPIPPGINYSYNPNLPANKSKQGTGVGIHQTLLHAPMKIETGNTDKMPTPSPTGSGPMDSSTHRYSGNACFDNQFGLGLDFQSPHSGLDTPGEGYHFNDWLTVDNDEAA